MDLVPYTPEEDSGGLDTYIRQASARYDVPEERIRAVIDTESAGNPKAVSRAGAKGLMQLMDGTSRDLGVTDPFDPGQNIDGGTRYLRQQFDRFGNWDQAHAAYNAGPTRVARGDNLPAETRDYVQKISDRVGSEEAQPSGLTLHPYEPEAQPGLTLHPYEAPKTEGGPGLMGQFAELAKVPTKVVGEGAAFFGGLAPMVATYLSYAVNRAAGADPDQAHAAAMAARERVDPGEGLAKLTAAVGVDKSWIQSDTFRHYMDELNGYVTNAAETYFPAQDSIAKTGFEDLGNLAIFGALGAGAHAAKGKIASALPGPRVIEDKFAPQPATEAASVAPAEPVPVAFVDPNAQARAGLVESVDNPLPPETSHADVVSPAEPIMRAQSLDEAINAAEQALLQPTEHMPVEEVVLPELAQPEIRNGQNATEIPAEPQLERAANDNGSDGLSQPAAPGPEGRTGTEDARNYQPGADQVAEAQHVQEQSPGAVPFRNEPEVSAGVRLENPEGDTVAGPRPQGDHQPGAEEVAFRDYTVPKSDPAKGLIKGQVQTFDSAEQAQAFASKMGLRGFTPRAVDDTFVLSRPPLTVAQKANTARLADTTKTVQAHDSLPTMLRKWGGIDVSELTRDGADPADIVKSLRFAYRKNGGLSLDAVAERMAEAGFDVRDEMGAVDSAKARDLLQEVLDGNEVYTPEGMEIRKARAEERRQAGLEPTREELASAGLTPARAEHVSLVARAAELDESHVERLAIQYGDDEAGFLRAVQEFTDDQGHEAAARGKAGTPAPRPAEEVDRPTALKRLSEAAERIRTSDPATVVAHVPELDAARAAAVRAGAAPHEIIQSMEAPRPKLTTQEIADVLKREPLRKPETPAPAGVDVSGEHPTASWVIRNKGTGEVLFETFDRKKVDALNTEKYEAVPIQEYLGSINNAAKREGSIGRSIDQVPPALLNRIKVSVEQFHEGEGVKTVEVPAKQALADLDAEISAMRKLLECVGL
jgi:hypothetical protein